MTTRAPALAAGSRSVGRNAARCDINQQLAALQTEPSVGVRLHAVTSFGLTGLSTCQPSRSTGWLHLRPEQRDQELQLARARSRRSLHREQLHGADVGLRSQQLRRGLYQRRAISPANAPGARRRSRTCRDPEVTSHLNAYQLTVCCSATASSRACSATSRARRLSRAWRPTALRLRRSRSSLAPLSFRDWSPEHANHRMALLSNQNITCARVLRPAGLARHVLREAARRVAPQRGAACKPASRHKNDPSDHKRSAC